MTDRLRAVFPPARWLRDYRAEWLARDAVSGVTLAAYAIPVSLAYATLAGLPPHGVYAYLVAGVAYALFGTSRQLAIGPTSAMSLLIGTTVAGMAAGDPARFIATASLTALVAGRGRRRARPSRIGRRRARPHHVSGITLNG